MEKTNASLTTATSRVRRQRQNEALAKELVRAVDQHTKEQFMKQLGSFGKDRNRDLLVDDISDSLARLLERRESALSAVESVLKINGYLTED